MKTTDFLTVMYSVAVTLVVVAGAHALGQTASENVHIMKSWSRAMPSVSTNGAAYFTAMKGTEEESDDFPEPAGQPCDPFIGTDRVMRLGKEPGENFQISAESTSESMKITASVCSG